MTDLLRGLLPVAPTVFREDESMDIDGQRRVVDFLVDSGAAGVCTLANYSEQFSLTDRERTQIVEATVDQVAGRVAVCVATSHYSARIAAERSRQAQGMGADMVMLMPPFVGATMSVDADGVVEFFRRVADATDLPIMVQDAPMSATGLPLPLLQRLAREIPQVQYAKIEVRQSADKIRALAESVAEELPGLFDGEEAVTLIPDLRAGAQGSMSSAMVPDLLSAVLAAFQGGAEERAELLWEEVLPLLQFENRQCGISAAKIVLREGGVIASDASRAPLPAVHPATKRQLIALARRKQALALRWA